MTKATTWDDQNKIFYHYLSLKVTSQTVVKERPQSIFDEKLPNCNFKILVGEKKQGIKQIERIAGGQIKYPIFYCCTLNGVNRNKSKGLEKGKGRERQRYTLFKRV